MPSSAISAAFQQRFATTASLLVRAPGRVNLIGEHTDYNDGFVLPAAINKAIYFAVALNGTTEVRLHSVDKEESYSFELADARAGSTLWANYLKGIVAGFQQRGLAGAGFDCAFGGNVPMGAGLSSSAAVGCGLAFALNSLWETGLSRLELAQISQQAEHQFAGVQCGIMDQFASLFGSPGHVIRLDCRSLEHSYFPFAADSCRVVLCNSGVKHSLASSEYNTRRQECEQGAAVLRRHVPSLRNLRDATPELLQQHRAELGELVYRRCLYVVEENLRVERACQCLADGDLAGFGQQMYASHAGLRDQYEVSCQELDLLVAAAREQPGVWGARMMGGGFGGCTINLVEADHAAAFQEHMRAFYEQTLARPLETYETSIVGGVEALAPVLVPL